MKTPIPRLVLFLAGSLAMSCGPGDCPTRTVVLDGGMEGLPEIGAYGTHQVCLVVCGGHVQGCRREKETVFTCSSICE